MADQSPSTDSGKTTITSPAIVVAPTVGNPNTNSTNVITFNVAVQFPVKLTTDNYSSWSRQFISLLKVYELYEFLLGTRPCPPVDPTPDSPYDIWFATATPKFNGDYHNAMNSVQLTSFNSYGPSSNHPTRSGSSNWQFNGLVNRGNKGNHGIAQILGIMHMWQILHPHLVRQEVNGGSIQVHLIMLPQTCLTLHYIRNMVDHMSCLLGMDQDCTMGVTLLQGHNHHGVYGLAAQGPPKMGPMAMAGDKDTYHSTIGYVVFLGSNFISWRACKQKTIARSSTEVEYRALAAASSELVWIKHLLHELGHPVSECPAIYCDNVGATHLSSNPVMHTRMKDIAIDLHFVRELVDHKVLRVSHISTVDQLADGLTKPLSLHHFTQLQSKIGVTDGSSILRGRIKEITTD
ncbi:hypothetical protein SLEP1_g26770 [Rubroshorea leprosula]|uniref:Retrotransposon Copia-like N-terminal domain-containing protein n=1 Tax=Rubroshorea leprosula TaxID=152421 RepID=A0AAV5JUI0_9ROSI|nr:hypothetical protein SLEP1_g26770 [Rubroshorea leprosula]